MVCAVLAVERRHSLRVVEVEVHLTTNKIVFEFHLTEHFTDKQIETSLGKTYKGL